MKNLIILSILVFSYVSLNAQQKETLYFLLNKGAYDKSLVVKNTTIITTRIDSIYTFTLPCDCNKQKYITFLRGINPEVGRVNLPIKRFTKDQLGRTKFIPFKQLITVMKANDSKFNNKFILYFVEFDSKANVYKAYHVFKMTLFSDDDIDYIVR